MCTVPHGHQCTDSACYVNDIWIHTGVFIDLMFHPTPLRWLPCYFQLEHCSPSVWACHRPALRPLSRTTTPPPRARPCKIARRDTRDWYQNCFSANRALLPTRRQAAFVRATMSFLIGWRRRWRRCARMWRTAKKRARSPRPSSPPHRPVPTQLAAEERFSRKMELPLTLESFCFRSHTCNGCASPDSRVCDLLEADSFEGRVCSAMCSFSSIAHCAFPNLLLNQQNFRRVVQGLGTCNRYS